MSTLIVRNTHLLKQIPFTKCLERLSCNNVTCPLLNHSSILGWLEQDKFSTCTTNNKSIRMIKLGNRKASRVVTRPAYWLQMGLGGRVAHLIGHYKCWLNIYYSVTPLSCRNSSMQAHGTGDRPQTRKLGGNICWSVNYSSFVSNNSALCTSIPLRPRLALCLLSFPAFLSSFCPARCDLHRCPNKPIFDGSLAHATLLLLLFCLRTIIAVAVVESWHSLIRPRFYAAGLIYNLSARCSPVLGMFSVTEWHEALFLWNIWRVRPLFCTQTFYASRKSYYSTPIKRIVISSKHSS